VMDEPTNNLDIWSIESLEDVLREYEGCIILVSHDREFVQNICDHFVMIDRLKFRSVRSVQEYLNRNRPTRESNDNEASRLSFQEKRKLTNRRKSLCERYDLLHNEEEELSRKIEGAQLKMGLYVTNYEKLQEFQATIESSEEKILELLEEKENLERELEELDRLLGE